MIGIIDDLKNKGKFKSAHLSDEMIKKEYEVGKKNYASAIASYEASNFKWQQFRHIMQYFMLSGHYFIKMVTVKKTCDKRIVH